MWDEAAKIASSMTEGEFYLLRNVRARVSNGGYLEAKLVEPKITKLEESDAENNPCLKALLAFVLSSSPTYNHLHPFAS